MFGCVQQWTENSACPDADFLRQARHFYATSKLAEATGGNGRAPPTSSSGSNIHKNKNDTNSGSEIIIIDDSDDEDRENSSNTPPPPSAFGNGESESSSAALARGGDGSADVGGLGNAPAPGPIPSDIFGPDSDMESPNKRARQSENHNENENHNDNHNDNGNGNNNNNDITHNDAELEQVVGELLMDDEEYLRIREAADAEARARSNFSVPSINNPINNQHQHESSHLGPNSGSVSISAHALEAHSHSNNYHGGLSAPTGRSLENNPDDSDDAFNLNERLEILHSRPSSSWLQVHIDVLKQDDVAQSRRRASLLANKRKLEQLISSHLAAATRKGNLLIQVQSKLDANNILEQSNKHLQDLLLKSGIVE